MDRPRVIIAGAGLGGLAAGLACLRAGIPVTILEKAPHLGEIGAGLSLFTGAIAALAALEVLDHVADAGWAATGGRQLHFQTGEQIVVWTEIDPKANDPGTQLKVHRADLHGILVRAIQRLDPAAIRTSADVVDVAQDGQRASAILAGGERVEGAVLIGADGIRSGVRASLWGAGKPNFTGWVAWRGLVAMRDLPRFDVPTSAKWIGPLSEVLTYPVRRGLELNYVASMESPGWEVESWTEPSTIEAILEHFGGWHPWIVSVIQRTAPETVAKWALFDRDPMPAWTQGRITVLGDAAHPMLPYNGMGAGMALEDGVVLGRCLAEFGASPAGLEHYEAARRPRTTVAQQLARASAPSKVASELADGSAARPKEDVLRQRLAFRSYDPRLVPI